MLKALTISKSEMSDIHTKCGEIHYLKGNWHYLCIYCALIVRTHDDFCNHLKSKHFDGFMYTETPFFYKETTHLKSSNSKSAKLTLDDPLCWSPKEKEPWKTENIQKDITLHVLNDPSVECDVETYDCENSCHIGPDIIEKDESNEEPNMEDLQANDESSIKAESLSDNETQNETEIDWNTPFKPNYLKSSQKRPYRPRKQPFCCTFCGRTFRRRYQFDTHLHIHTGAKPHQCEICGRQFRAVATLQRHLNTHEQRYFVCSYCNKSFSHRPACLSHEKRHTQERNEPCDLCEKQFYTVNQLDTHKRRVHKMSNDDLPFACDICPKRYRTTSMLSIHKGKIHYKTAEFQCEKCEKKFVDHQRLEEHKKIHIDGKILTHDLSAT